MLLNQPDFQSTPEATHGLAGEHAVLGRGDGRNPPPVRTSPGPSKPLGCGQGTAVRARHIHQVAGHHLTPRG